MNIKKIILSNKILYETYFFIFGKKINRKKIEKKIESLNKNKKMSNEIINGLVVSLTSYGERLNDLKYTLYSLIKQSVQPEKIIVWIGYNEKIPDELKCFEKFNIEFKLCKDIRSYKKLIPALLNYKDKIIVTADDDIFYKKKWLKKLWECHLKYPDAKITHIAHEIKLTDYEKMLPYSEWNHNICSCNYMNRIFPVGCGGILYPIIEIPDIFVNDNVFMKLCPNADDVWFYFMGLMSGVRVIIVPHPYNRLKYVDIYKEYGLNKKQTLQSLNVNNNFNDIQIDNVIKYFSLNMKDLLEKK